MSIPEGYKFTKDHEWLNIEGGKNARIGITDYAQSELGDVVFVELPEVGRTLKKGESFATVESVKAVSDVYAPVDGKVIEINSSLVDAPETLNREPHDSGWMIVLELTNPNETAALLDSSSYNKYISEIAK